MACGLTDQSRLELHQFVDLLLALGRDQWHELRGLEVLLQLRHARRATDDTRHVLVGEVPGDREIPSCEATTLSFSAWVKRESRSDTIARTFGFDSRDPSIGMPFWSFVSPNLVEDESAVSSHMKGGGDFLLDRVHQSMHQAPVLSNFVGGERRAVRHRCSSGKVSYSFIDIHLDNHGAGAARPRVAS